jgi:hypothetical protein
MSMIVWLFRKVMPWLGVYFTVLTIIFFIVFIVEFFIVKRKIYNDQSKGSPLYDFIDEIEDLLWDSSIIMNIIPFIILFLIIHIIRNENKEIDH